MDFFIVVFPAALLICSLWFLIRRDRRASLKNKKEFDSILYDMTRPESERRARLLQKLIADGYLIQRQEPGLVTAARPKEKFSLLLFIFLLCLWGLGLIYLVWYAFQRDEVRQFVLPT